MCYKTGKYAVCRRVHASFGREILQAPAVKGLNVESIATKFFLNAKCSVQKVFSTGVKCRIYSNKVLLERKVFSTESVQYRKCSESV